MMEGCWRHPCALESRKNRKTLTTIEFVMFWKQKKQESIEIIEFVVFWVYLACSGTTVNKKNTIIIMFVVFWERTHPIPHPP